VAEHDPARGGPADGGRGADSRAKGDVEHAQRPHTRTTSNETDAAAAPGSADAEPQRRPRVRRRVTTEPVPGYDPSGVPEPPRHAEGENDERLKRDKPPHWG